MILYYVDSIIKVLDYLDSVILYYVDSIIVLDYLDGIIKVPDYFDCIIKVLDYLDGIIEGELAVLYEAVLNKILLTLLLLKNLCSSAQW